MKALKLVIALIAITLAYNNLDRGQNKSAAYWGLVTVYWIMNALT